MNNLNSTQKIAIGVGASVAATTIAILVYWIVVKYPWNFTNRTSARTIQVGTTYVGPGATISGRGRVSLQLQGDTSVALPDITAKGNYVLDDAGFHKSDYVK